MGPLGDVAVGRQRRTCGEDLAQDHLRHLLGAQPGPPQHLPDGGRPQLVCRQRRQAAVEGAWAETEGESSAPARGTPGKGGGAPAARPGPGREPAAPPLTDGGPGGRDEDDGVRAHGGGSGRRGAAVGAAAVGAVAVKGAAVRAAATSGATVEPAAGQPLACCRSRPSPAAARGGPLPAPGPGDGADWRPGPPVPRVSVA